MAETNRKLQDQFDEANEAMARGDLALAERLCNGILKSNPLHADGLCLLGEIMERQGRFDDAISYYRLAIDIHNEVPIYFNNLGNALSAKGQHEDALAQYERAVALDAKFAVGYYNIAIEWNLMGDAQRAKEYYLEALNVKPRYADAHLNLGVILREEGALDEALARFKRALQIDPNFALAHYNMGLALREQGKLESAKFRFERATELDARYAPAHYYLGLCLWGEGKATLAGEAFRQVTQLDPYYTMAHYYLALACYEQGRLAEAESGYRKVLELDPALRNAHNELGRCLLDLGRSQEALEDFLAELELYPDNYYAIHNIGIVFTREGRYEEALEQYKDAIALKPDYFEAFYKMAKIYLKLEQPELAQECFRRCLEINPSDPFDIRLVLNSGDMPERASEVHMKNLYAQRAEYWDTDPYRGYQLVIDALNRFSAPGQKLDICDAGCGTGLVGMGIRNRARVLDGIDFSAAMLEKARAKGIYNHLFEDDMVARLQRSPERYDAITCAATLIHFSDLEPAFQAAYAALKERGIFIMTLFPNLEDEEVVYVAPDLLGEGGCFVHGTGYVRKTAAEAGFEVEQMDSEIHEYHNGVAEMGLIITLRKKG